MARAGFIYTGTVEDPDSAQCFLCHKALDGWERNDDPWEEHLKHSSKCLFIKYGKPEEELKCQEIINIQEVLLKNVIDHVYEEKIKQIQNEAEDFKNTLKVLKTFKKKG